MDEEIEKIIQEVDKDGNGEIDYQEFCDMVRKSSFAAAARHAAASLQRPPRRSAALRGLAAAPPAAAAGAGRARLRAACWRRQRVGSEAGWGCMG